MTMAAGSAAMRDKEYFERNIHLKDLALRCGVIHDGRVMIGGENPGKTVLYPWEKHYDPKKISFNPFFSGADVFHGAALNYEGDLTWCYSKEKFPYCYIYPQVVEKGGDLKVVNRVKI